MPQSNLQKIQESWDEGSALSGVRYELFEGDPNFITSVIFRLDAIEIKFKAEPNYDEITVELNNSETDSDCEIVDVSKISPWTSLIGSQSSWIWLLTNNQGYEDGVRIEFRNEQEKVINTVDLIVMASSIKLYTSTEINGDITRVSTRSAAKNAPPR